MIGTGCTLGRAPRTNETLPDFHEWCRVTRHPRIFLGLTGCQQTPGKWGVTLYVAIGFPRVVLRQRIPIATHSPGLRTRQSTGCEHDRPEHAHEHAHQQRCYTHYKANITHNAHNTNNVCDSEHNMRATKLTTRAQLRARQTCPVANSVLCCTLFELLFIDIVHRHCSGTL